MLLLLAVCCYYHARWDENPSLTYLIPQYGRTEINTNFCCRALGKALRFSFFCLIRFLSSFIWLPLLACLLACLNAAGVKIISRHHKLRFV